MNIIFGSIVVRRQTRLDRAVATAERLARETKRSAQDAQRKARGCLATKLHAIANRIA